MRHIFFIVLILVVAQSDVLANDREEELAKKSELLLAYFDCAVYAELASPADMAGLFDKGLIVGRQFYEGLQNGELSPEFVHANIPLTLLMGRGGPSPDFILGTVWEDRVAEIYRSVEREYSCGIYATPTYGFRCGDELRQSFYEMKFRDKNCALLP